MEVVHGLRIIRLANEARIYHADFIISVKPEECTDEYVAKLSKILHESPLFTGSNIVISGERYSAYVCFSTDGGRIDIENIDVRIMPNHNAVDALPLKIMYEDEVPSIIDLDSILADIKTNLPIYEARLDKIKLKYFMFVGNEYCQIGHIVNEANLYVQIHIGNTHSELSPMISGITMRGFITTYMLSGTLTMNMIETTSTKKAL